MAAYRKLQFNPGEINMSMTRTDALTQLARGLRKFDGMTAGQVLATEWPGLKALPVADLEYFEKHSSKPADIVAQACHGRSMARTDDPLAKNDRL